MTKEEAQKCIDMIDVVTRNGVPVNSLVPLITVAQVLQRDLEQIGKNEKQPEEESGNNG